MNDMNQHLYRCPICGFHDIYALSTSDSIGLDHWYVFCNHCKTSFGNEYAEDSKDETIKWWNSIGRSGEPL